MKKNNKIKQKHTRNITHRRPFIEFTSSSNCKIPSSISLICLSRSFTWDTNSGGYRSQMGCNLQNRSNFLRWNFTWKSVLRWSKMKFLMEVLMTSIKIWWAKSQFSNNTQLKQCNALHSRHKEKEKEKKLNNSNDKVTVN